MFKRRSIITLLLVMIGGIGTFFIIRFASRKKIKKEVKKFDFEKIDTIDVKADNSVIEIIPTNDKVSTLEWVGDESKLRQFTADIDRSTLVIAVKQKRQKLFSHESSLKVYVPEKVYQSIRVKADEEGITAEDIDVKDMLAEADNGDINLTNIHAGNVKVISDNGKVNLTDVDGTLVVEADNGSISLIADHIDRDIDFETDNAGIKIQTEVDPTNVLFDLKTDNGKTNMLGSSDRNIVIGNGDNTIRLKTNNGGITVKK